MKKAILISYITTIRVIANVNDEGDFNDSVIEDNFQKALDNMKQNGALDSYGSSEEDIEMPYSKEDDLNL